ncbi:small heat shock protein [Boletus edulis]|uniref:HSP20-like chaperone n=1 Tax=Boletus edulis BED1 TaxID=1328754 RepID=A0AAD4BGR0_BOLED|nr:small heat shock protein [Boletus edulis]KAF8428427.1 HSP20-like chaperone [Boletus edulis BED1]
MSINLRKRPRTSSPPSDSTEISSDGELLAGAIPTYTPRMNIYEDFDSNMVTITFELPGLKRDDVAIHLLYNELTISGQIMDQCPQEMGGYSCREIPYGKFHRFIKIPLGTMPEDLKARMEDGLLILTYPKFPTHAKPHRIPIA